MTQNDRQTKILFILCFHVRPKFRRHFRPLIAFYKKDKIKEVIYAPAEFNYSTFNSENTDIIFKIAVQITRFKGWFFIFLINIIQYRFDVKSK